MQRGAKALILTRTIHRPGSVSTTGTSSCSTTGTNCWSTTRSTRIQLDVVVTVIPNETAPKSRASDFLHRPLSEKAAARPSIMQDNGGV